MEVTKDQTVTNSPESGRDQGNQESLAGGLRVGPAYLCRDCGQQPALHGYYLCGECEQKEAEMHG